MYESDKITDLAYLAAVNDVIVSKAYEIEADVASRTGTYPLDINSFQGPHYSNFNIVIPQRKEDQEYLDSD